MTKKTTTTTTQGIVSNNEKVPSSFSYFKSGEILIHMYRSTYTAIQNWYSRQTVELVGWSGYKSFHIAALAWRKFVCTTRAQEKEERTKYWKQKRQPSTSHSTHIVHMVKMLQHTHTHAHTLEEVKQKKQHENDSKRWDCGDYAVTYSSLHSVVSQDKKTIFTYEKKRQSEKKVHFSG